MRTKQLLMTPGPTPVPLTVARRAIEAIIDERTEEFKVLFERVISHLQYLLNTDAHVRLISSSITGACEAVMQNLFSANDEILVVSNGYFANRWKQLALNCGLKVKALDYDWATDYNFQEINALIQSSPNLVAAICVHCESSTGQVNDIREFARLSKNLITIVDAASSLGAVEIYMDTWGIDVLVSGSQKALMCPPGLSIVAYNERAARLSEHSTLAKYYFDWTYNYTLNDSTLSLSQWTPPVSLITQLDTALAMIKEEGIGEVYHRHILLGKMLRAGLKALGLQLITPDHDHNASLTAFKPDSSVSAETLMTLLKEDSGIQLAPGTGMLNGKCLRIGHCGYFDGYDILSVLSALEMALIKTGWTLSPGISLTAAQQEWIRYDKCNK